MNNNNLDEVFDQLNSALPYTPVDELAQSLQLAVERITFSDIAMRAETQKIEDVHLQIENIFGQDVPTQLVTFIKQLADNKKLSLLHGEQGRLFLQNYISKLKSMNQVEIITAVKLSNKAKQQYADMLREHYQMPIRVVYTTSPNVVAGFILRDQSKSVDRSLGTATPRLLGQKLNIQTGVR